MNPKAVEKLGIKPFDAADYLQSDEDCALYLQACLEDAPGDTVLFAKALGDVARAGHDAVGPRHGHEPGRAVQGFGRKRQPQLCHRYEGAGRAGSENPR